MYVSNVLPRSHGEGQKRRRETKKTEDCKELRKKYKEWLKVIPQKSKAVF